MDNNFDWETYISNYEDLQKKGILTKEEASIHWTLFGKKEGRKCEKLIKDHSEINNNQIAIVSYLFNNNLILNEMDELGKLHDVYIVTDKEVEFKNINLIKTNTFKEIENISDKILKTKYYKTHLHQVEQLKKYNYLIWIEPYTMAFKEKIDNLKNILDENNDFYLLVKNNYKLTDYYLEKSNYENYPILKLKNQIAKYLKENNLYKMIFYETDYFLFKNNTNNNTFFDYWWTEIKNNTILDELSFGFLINKYNKKVRTFFNNDFIKNDIIIKNKFLLKKSLNTKINCISKILWINLDRSEKRKLYMENLLKNVNVPNTRISAIDGSKFNFSNGLRNVDLRKRRSNIEISCLLSHIKAINSLKKEAGEYFMICEDDIVFSNVFIIEEDLENIIKNAPKFDILLIYKTYDKPIKQDYVFWEDYFSNIGLNISGTVAYIITKSGVDKIISMCSYINDVFHFNKNYNLLDVADIYLYKYVKTCVYKYNFISTLEEDSTIHPNHLTIHKNSNIFQLNNIYNNIFK